ncbi:MAG: ATP synthase F0 subunit B [Bacilli bacterium]|nr:ATP synthase F0 subunit B [Bacilli bacterium]
MEGLRITVYDSNPPFTAKDFLDKLFPNFWSLVINLLALIVLFVFLYFVAYKPVKKYLDARKDYVEKNIKDSEEAKATYESKLALTEDMVKDARAEASEIISKAKADAEVSAQNIIKEADEAAKARQLAADEAIAQAEEKSRRAIHDEIVNVALEASKQVLGREISREDNEKLLNDFIEEVDA